MKSVFALHLACAAMLVIGLPACHREDPQIKIDAQAAAMEATAEQAARAFDDAVADENWPLAKAQGEVLLADYPNSEAASRIRPKLAAVAAKANAARDRQRIAALWSYDSQAVTGGQQLSAAIYSKEEVDTDGGGAKPVRLIFRDHPAWGKSAYLVLQAGDFDCYRGCKVQVKLDDAEAIAMGASRPKTDEAIAMFIEDERVLWRKIENAKILALEFPTKDVGKKTAVFEVGGLDRSKLPKWN